ncbi:MAG: AEC family transporter [Oscillospiraceae bacterium]
MENLLLSFNVISPIFFMMAVGYIIKRFKILDEHTLNGMNNIAFKVFFPIMLFNSIYKTDLKDALNPSLIGFAVVVVVCIFLILCFIVPLIEKDSKKRGVLIQGIFRSNFVIFGLPIAISLCGPENIGATSLLIAVIVPLYNALSIVALELHRNSKIQIKTVIKGILTNPLVIGGFVGILALLIHLRLPTSLDTAVGDIAKITTPLSLILLGGSFNFSDIQGNKKQILIGVIGKLIIMPLIFIPICILVGFRGVQLIPLVVMIGAPPAVSTFTMAGQMDADQTLAGQLVVFGSIGSILTMFLWIFTLKTMGLF